jgi:hypothetical protein
MIKFEINGKEYQFPQSWDDITMKQYCHLFHNLPTAPSEASDEEKLAHTIDTEAIIISRLLGENDDFVSNLPIEVFLTLKNEMGFIYALSDFTESKIFYLNIDGKRYWVPEPKDMSLRQYIDADMIMKEEGEQQFIELLACLLLPMGKDGKYEYDGKYQDLMSKIEKMKASECLPFIYTFVKKKQLSKKVTEAYSKVGEVADQLLHNTQGS